ncbi:MgtC/SapB family protein [Haloterrigena sp. H1]|uniref:MgtC/SapB family protein n=1 Tax=Haloterrigena sp. H1 TaxID=2552943 RepID=UPI00110F3B6D|nr:MgtC/SapB family protein [Haloterrigena sp. H1]TMT77642.1 MgtC/SapB family protein [Haloterrigena sp. H1]TMT87812.1 MgtC/SapB family protein [Haloterrigena sp. H1]
MADPLAAPLQVLVFRVAIAFGIGALIGLEREQSESGGTFAGSRTFPLFALYGALVQAFFPGLLPIAVGTLVIPLTVAYLGKIWFEGDIGLTTVMAALLTVVLGALTTHSERGAVLAVAVGGVVTVLLSAKGTIHDFVDRIDEAERRASIKFILVVLVVFPLLPDRELDVAFGLNPRFIWLMVVFVTGLSFVAYVLSRTIGTERGIALTGILGGFVSSTATTVSMAERASAERSLSQICAFSTITASIVMFPRALIEVAVVNRDLLPYVAVPLAVMTALGASIAAIVYWRATTTLDEEAETELANPFQLRPALFFGAVFAAVLLVSESAHSLLGESGIYATAFVSGLADVDAITLTLSRLAADGTITPHVAATGIVIGAIANTIVKAGLAWVIGTTELGRLVTAGLGAVSAIGLLVVFLA